MTFLSVCEKSWLAPSLFFSAVISTAVAQQIGRGEQERSFRETAPAAAYSTSMDVLDDKRPLRIGDRLSMRVVEERQAPVQLFVTDSGEVEVPLIGRVHAQGLTCKQLAYRIKGPFEREYFYKATVIVALDTAGLKSPEKSISLARFEIRARLIFRRTKLLPLAKLSCGQAALLILPTDER
jgi:hypothetical protein